MKNFEAIRNSNVSTILSQSKLFFPKNAMEKLKLKKKKKDSNSDRPEYEPLIVLTKRKKIEFMVLLACFDDSNR